MSAAPLMISPATNQNSLTREGALLRHCVAGYGEDVALGKTSIFFIRHLGTQKAFTTRWNLTSRRSVQAGIKVTGTPPGRRRWRRLKRKWLAWVKKGVSGKGRYARGRETAGEG